MMTVIDVYTIQSNAIIFSFEDVWEFGHLFCFGSYIRDYRMTIDSDSPNLSPTVGGKRREKERKGEKEMGVGGRIHYYLFI